jgi:hypothetical protein
MPRYPALLLLLLPACQMSQDDYAAWLTSADSALGARQDSVTAAFRLGTYSRFDYNTGNGILVFSDSGIAKVLADVEFVGDISRHDSTWAWAWKVPDYPARFTAKARKARLYGWLHGVRKLRTSGWGGDNTDGWEMTSLTMAIAGGDAAYRAPTSDSASYTFMLLRNIHWAPPGHDVSAYLGLRPAPE